MHLSTLAHHTHAHTQAPTHNTHTHTHTQHSTHPPTNPHTHPIVCMSDDSSPPLSEGDISVATSASINSTFFAKVANWGRELDQHSTRAVFCHTRSDESCVGGNVCLAVVSSAHSGYL